MPVLVDGNNLLFAARALEEDGSAVGRSRLCDALGAWARRTGESTHVVFDGPAPSADLAGQIGNPDISVSYSGVGTSADALITRILEEHSAARRILVVSTDRAVRRAAKRRQARSIRSEEFWTALKRDLLRPPPQRTEPQEKRTGLTQEGAKHWLRLFGLD